MAFPSHQRAESYKTEDVRGRDECCRMTGTIDACEVAHIIPKKENEWFMRNSMDDYSGAAIGGINDAGNMLLLRSDMHKTFDALRWVIVPKTTYETDGTEKGIPKPQLVFHLIDPSPQLAALYHNVPLGEVRGLCKEYLLARFALAVFPQVVPFLRRWVKRYLITVGEDGKSSSELCDGARLAGLYAERTSSPTKRSQAGGESPTKRSRTNSQSPSKRAQNVDDRTVPSPIAETLCDREHITRDNTNPLKRCRASSEGTLPYKKRFTRKEALPNHPCTCAMTSTAVQPPTPHSFSAFHLTSSSGNESGKPEKTSQSLFCAARDCKNRLEFQQLRNLREQGLKQERAKSGMEEYWREWEQWYDDAVNGRLPPGYLEKQDIRDMFWFQGKECEPEDQIKDWPEGDQHEDIDGGMAPYEV